MKSTRNIQRSKFMDILYGEKQSLKVFNRLEQLGPELNDEIQCVAYDHFWARPGLSIKEKSLLTVTSLICLKREEQTAIHMHGLLHSGASDKDLGCLLNYMRTKTNEESFIKAKSSAESVLTELKADGSEFERVIQDNVIILDQRNKLMIDISAESALGNLDALALLLQDIVERDLTDISQEDVKNIFMHQIVYCGFPTSMTSFGILHNVVTAANSNKRTYAKPTGHSQNDAKQGKMLLKKRNVCVIPEHF